MPERVRLGRQGGAVLVPEGAVRVDRGTIFGNPFRCDDPALAAEAFRCWLDGEPVPPREGVELALTPSPDRRRTLLRRLPELRGRDLACWCAADAAACHADLLLERANAPEGALLEAAAAAALTAARAAPDPVTGLVAGLRAARDAEQAARPARPYSAGRNAAALTALGAALRRRATTQD